MARLIIIIILLCSFIKDYSIRYIIFLYSCVVLGRSIVVYSNNDNTTMGCGQILPENLAAMRVRLSFPAVSGIDHR